MLIITLIRNSIAGSIFNATAYRLVILSLFFLLTLYQQDKKYGIIETMKKKTPAIFMVISLLISLALQDCKGNVVSNQTKATEAEWDVGTLDISVEDAQHCIEEQAFKVDSIELLGKGFDNCAFLVNDSFIFRFPRHKSADVYQLLYENVVLHKLQKIVSLEIPNPLYIGTPTEIYPYHFQGYKKIEGISANEVDWDQEGLENCIKSVAHFLKALHSVSAATAQEWGMKASGYDQTDCAAMVQVLQPRIHSLIEMGMFPLDETALAAEIAWAKSLHIPQGQKCLVHSDLHFAHLLFKDKKLNGIIDWGDVDISHPVVDFSIIHELFPESLHHLFFEIYGDVAIDVWEYAKFLALKSALTSMLYGHTMGDKKVFDSAVGAYKRLIS